MARASLTLQEKLALVMTSAGSMRNAAALVGVSHQKIGRWLREGELRPEDQDGNIPLDRHGEHARFGQIPDDSATIAAINQAFEIHRQVAREQARHDKVPFNAVVPVYVERRPLRTGFLGDRVISGNTEFIRQDMRMIWVRGMAASERFYKVNVRSIVDLKMYFDIAAGREIQSGDRQRYSRKVLAGHMMQAWVNKERREGGRIIDKAAPFPLYTRSENTMPGTDPYLAARGVEKMLQEKHSTAVGPKGTHFASEFLLQLIPADYVKSPTGFGGHSPTAARGRKTTARKTKRKPGKRKA